MLWWNLQRSPHQPRVDPPVAEDEVISCIASQYSLEVERGEIGTNCQTLVDARHRLIFYVTQSIGMMPTPSYLVSSDLGSLAPRVFPAGAA
jgi:hypothetical protein